MDAQILDILVLAVLTKKSIAAQVRCSNCLNIDQKR